MMFDDPKMQEVISADSTLMNLYRDLISLELQVQIELKKSQLEQTKRSLLDLINVEKVKEEKKTHIEEF